MVKAGLLRNAEDIMFLEYDQLRYYVGNPKTSANPDGYDASRTSGDLVDLRETDNGGTAVPTPTPSPRSAPTRPVAAPVTTSSSGCAIRSICGTAGPLGAEPWKARANTW